MSLRLRLLLGEMRGSGALPALSLRGGTQLPEVFAGASAVRDPGGDIQLVVDDSLRARTASMPGDPATSLQLHQALKVLTRNRPDEPRVWRIGMVFADRYAPDEGAFGVMFDRGFATGDDGFGGDQRYRLPREGCAVFLGAIRARRTNDEEYRRQVFYTAVHELGHLFNLGHSSGTNYMVKSRRDATHGADHFQFEDPQQRWLSDCSQSPAVWPGGHRFRGRDSQDDPGSEEAVGLELAAKLTREVMWPWEPVELELRLQLAADAPASVQVAREFDPGYPRLRVWIEEPNGERRLLRSPRHYCRGADTRALAPGESIERDLSIFGESGGYTFRTPGVHQVWATWQQAGALIVSERCPLEILGPGARLGDEVAGLRSWEAARLLYYREGSRRSSTFRGLEDLARELEGPCGASLTYSIGRAHAHNSAAAPSTASRRVHAARAREWLGRACQHDALGGHSRRRGAEILEGLP